MSGTGGISGKVWGGRWLSALTLAALLSQAALAGRREAKPPGPPADFAVARELSLDFSDSPARRPTLRFQAWGQWFELELQESSPFSPAAPTIWRSADGSPFSLPQEAVYWSGFVSGQPDSSARLRASATSVEGLILLGNEVLLLEPARRYFPLSGSYQTIVSRLSAADLWFEASQCGLDAVAGDAPKVDPPALPQSKSESSEASHLREVEIRVLADSHYFARHGFASAERAQTLIHQLNALFERELGVTFRIAETVISTHRSQDPVGDSTVADALLEDLGRSKPLNGSDLAHLFTGRGLTGGTLGVAWTGSVCSDRYGVGLTQDLQDAKARLVATAHELAHGLGARHDGRGYCAKEGPGWIMWPTLDASASSFSGCSRQLVQVNLPRFQCVSALDPAPLPEPRIVGPQGAASPRVRFEWEAVEGAAGYQLEVYDEDSGNQVFEASLQETRLQPPFDFQIGRKYRWRVATIAQKGISSRTPWQALSVTGWRWPR